MSERLIVRSYRRVFAIERRIYRVDRWAIPVPGGVPLRGVAYFMAALALVFLAQRLPGIGVVLGALNPALRFVVLPLAVAVLGTQATPDGRPAHRFAWEWVRLRIRARRRSAGRTVPLEGEPIPWDGTLGTRWDEDAPALHRGRVGGPARVTFAVGVGISDHRNGVRAEASVTGKPGAAVVVGSGAVVEVHA